MKLKITYATKERKWHTPHTYSNVQKEAEFAPLLIIRTPCGSGSAQNRYYYSAWFEAPDDAEFTSDGKIREHINRKKNPWFSPKKVIWDGYAGRINETHQQS